MDHLTPPDNGFFCQDRVWPSANTSEQCHNISLHLHHHHHCHHHHRSLPLSISFCLVCKAKTKCLRYFHSHSFSFSLIEKFNVLDGKLRLSFHKCLWQTLNRPHPPRNFAETQTDTGAAVHLPHRFIIQTWPFFILLFKSGAFVNFVR